MSKKYIHNERLPLCICCKSMVDLENAISLFVIKILI